MSSNPERVVVMPAAHSMLAVRTAVVRHRDFPEVRGEGDSLSVAARRLADLLVRSLDSVSSDWRRENIERAIEDVMAFASRSQTKLPVLYE